jgi:hypothetical protein
MSSITDNFNRLVAPLIVLCHQGDIPAMKAMLTELKAAADALSAELATQIATLP